MRFFNPTVQYLEKYSRTYSTTASIQRVASSEQAKGVTAWRRERRREMVELKGRQQREAEGKLQPHSRVMAMAQVLVPRRIHFCLPFASGAPGLEIKILQYSIEYHTVKHTKAQPLGDGALSWWRVQDTELTYVTGHGNARSNLWKFKTWRFVYRGLTVI